MTDELASSDAVAGSPSAHGRWVIVLAVLVGVAVGAFVMHHLDGGDGTAAPAAAPDVRVSLAAHAGDLTHVDGDPVVSVPLVLQNLGPAPVRLLALRVDGPGASLADDPLLRPRLPLPADLEPGRPVDTRITVRSDCAVALRPVPVVTLVLADAAGQEHEVVADIPGMPALWGQTLAPLSCPSTAP